MIPQLTVTRFGRVLSSGRTRPCIVYAEDEGGEEIEFVVKFFGGACGIRGMICETMASQFASDLDLRIPEMCILEITKEFAAAVPDLEIASIMQRSIGENFATKKLPASYHVPLANRPLSVELHKAATEIFVFDALIQNPDRRVTKPNCQTDGNEFVILDHDLAFSFLAGVLFWKPPWENGSDFNFLKEHIFYEPLRKTEVNLDRISGAIESIKDEQIRAYAEVLPSEWRKEQDAITEVLDYVLALKKNIIPTLDAIQKTLL